MVAVPQDMQADFFPLCNDDRETASMLQELPKVEQERIQGLVKYLYYMRVIPEKLEQKGYTEEQWLADRERELSGMSEEDEILFRTLKALLNSKGNSILKICYFVLSEQRAEQRRKTSSEQERNAFRK